MINAKQARNMKLKPKEQVQEVTPFEKAKLVKQYLDEVSKQIQQSASNGNSSLVIEIERGKPVHQLSETLVKNGYKVMVEGDHMVILWSE